MSNPAHITEASAGPMLGDLTIGQLAYLHNHPEHPMRAEIDHDCNGRPNPASSSGDRIPCPTSARFKCMAYFAELTVCDDCRNAAIASMKQDAAKTYWQSICPRDFQDTDTKHADFPRAVYESLKDYKGGEPLFLYGPTRKGKTRLGLQMLKRCLLLNMHVGCLWPEELKHAAHSYNDRLKLLKWYGRYDVLFMDDALLTGAQDEKMADFLKDLIDTLIREKRRFIITSQIGATDYKEQATKSDKTTKVDMERIDALLARVREKARIVPVTSPEAKTEDGETSF